MFLSFAQLEAGLETIRNAPKESGRVELIVCRPATGARKVLEQAKLDCECGLVGDNWLAREQLKTAAGRVNFETQINLMNARAIALIAGSRERWPLAGDQFFVDLDLSPDNLPPGTQLSLGEATLVVTAEPHLGCAKFKDRFGKDAALFVNSEQGKALNLRGINARVVKPGVVKTGDTIQKTQDHLI